MRKIKSTVLRVLSYLAIAITFFALLSIVLYICVNGVPNLSLSLIFGKFSSDNPSMRFAIVTTVVLVILALVVSVPIGLGCAIYLTEYAPQTSKIVRAIRLATETLAGIPSIIYGLFGALFFGTALKMGYSILSGVLTVAIMILPTIIRTSEEAIKSVPDLYREGSFGLGAGKLRTIVKIIIPSAANGIFSAVILSVGRIVGETAALLFTLGSVAKMPSSIMDSSRTLAVHMYISTRDGGMAGRKVAFATGVILIVIVTLINIFTLYLSKKAGKMNEN
ncbi:MAG: phosphate ABC transporter permease PstA [Clostridia bacterium]|nr:phosphate ABC transporter permease PstA [Clostridia bacterium]